MTIFAIIPLPPPTPKLGATIAEKFGDSHFALDGGAGWLISATITAQQISEQLQITDGTSGSALIVEIASYFGRANPNVWSWIKENWNKPANA